MNYIKKVLRSCKDIIVIMLVQLMMIFITGLIYIVFINKDITNFYTQEFYYIIIILYIILIIIFKNKYKSDESKIKIKDYYSGILLGVSIACIYNMLMFKIGNVTNSNVNMFLSIIASGILGPILEELLFRKKLLNELLYFNSKNKAIFLSSLIFSLLHFGIDTIIYAFIMGIILSVIYLKYNNIKLPIVIHMSANIIVVFLNNFNIYILLLSLLGVIISILIFKK